MKNLFGEEITQELESIFEGVFTSDNSVSVEKTENGVKIFLEIPGVEKDHISVKTSNGKLIVSAHTKQGKPFAYKKEFKVSESLNIAKLKAKLSLGILKITIPVKQGKKTNFEFIIE